MITLPSSRPVRWKQITYFSPKLRQHADRFTSIERESVFLARNP